MQYIKTVISILTRLINALTKKSQPLWLGFKGLSQQKRFGQIYLSVGGLVLFLATAWWAYLGARLQNANADQIVNAFLFQSPNTLQSAELPVTHSFLIKWPLYFLVQAFGSAATGLVVITMAAVLITVGCLAALLYRLEKRPLVLGTYLLALASTLLLVPAVPAPGNLLPVNMAMLATRNLEYIIYILGLWLVLKYANFRNWHFWVGVILLGLLIASDKLFITISVGGALCALVFYSVTSGWNLVTVYVRWLLAGVAAVLVSLVTLSFINSNYIAQIVQTSSLGPYNLVHSVHDVVVGTMYAITGLLSNFGANPAATTTVLADIPHEALQQIFSASGPLILLNMCIFVGTVYAAVRLLLHSVRHNKSSDVVLEPDDKASVALLWSVIAVLGAFVLTDHYYAGDARYVTLSVFGLFIATASFWRRRDINTWWLAAFGTVILVAVAIALPGVSRSYNADRVAFAETEHRNHLVNKALDQHRTDLIVGDYWRVVPIKFTGSETRDIMPLGSCTEPRDTLTSTNWKYDLSNKRFAYLVSFDESLTDFPQCTLQQIEKAYGRPNSSVLIAGSLTHPKEMVLFYDRGSHKSDPATPQPIGGSSTVLPISLEEYPFRNCSVPTIMQVVAHEDDDLLFMSPDLPKDLQAGHCMRTVYITAGDAGADAFYWLGRMQGAEAAYSRMLGYTGIWVERIVQIKPNQVVTIANPRGNPKISLIFMYLPDGNMKGQGFGTRQQQSLEKLYSGSLPSIQSVYGNSSYTIDDLTSALSDLMHLYLPTELRTQSTIMGTQFVDHSDHRTVGRIAAKAYQNFQQKQFEGKVSLPVTFYRGYTGHELPQNLVGPELDEKIANFLTYGKYDGGICHGVIQCLHDPAYGAYLTRQYKAPL